MTVNSNENTTISTPRRTAARLASDELTVLDKLGEDVVTINLDITLKPVTWIALQKYALKHDCTLSESLENGLEESEQVASAINIKQSDR
ncbi:MAG: hypothetical protein QF406_10635 [Verrucomicrobiota bacterium]|nr:hypothetical protein [Verrucomicrobiota bacterium]